MSRVLTRTFLLCFLWVGPPLRGLSDNDALTRVCNPTGDSLEKKAAPALSNLTVENLFSAGWGESWVRRPNPDGAPDLTLLRVQSNLLLQSLRTDYYQQEPPASSSDRRVQYVSETAEYAVNRRLMLGLFGTFQDVEHKVGTGRDGWTYGGLARLQLIDTLGTSYAFNARVTAPNHGLGDTQTATSFALTGWHDLQPCGLDRTGIYWHIQEETLMGPRKPGVRQNSLTYDISLARTWTTPRQAVGNLSTFLETYARTDLDGVHRSRTLVTLTPGVRANFFHHHVVMFGIDLPVNEPRALDELYRVTYIYSF